jgi:hypothetical protein
VQVDPIKPILKAPRTKRLKLSYGEPPSNFAFNFKLRRYSKGRPYAAACYMPTKVGCCRFRVQGLGFWV